MLITTSICLLVLSALCVSAVDNEINLNYRLPNETYPEHYDIKITTNVHTGEKAFQGEVIIDIKVANATNSIVLHARRIEITRVTVANPSTGESEELSFAYELEREFLKLTRKINQQFAGGIKWKLSIIYSGKLQNDRKGFYLSKYKDDMGDIRYFAATKFESTNARQAIPCYDEPNKLANFTITIIHSPIFMAVSNMRVNEALSSAGKTVFLTTDRIPTYTVAFVVSSVSNGLTQQDLKSGMKVTEHLFNYYGFKLMPKMINVPLPNLSTAVFNNWGLASYNKNHFLYDKNTSAMYAQRNIAKSVAHGISHQWIDDFAKIKWWSYLWLKEGFANLFSYRALDDTYPEWDIWQTFHTIEYQNALDRDGISSSRPMTFYVQKPNEIESLYDAVSYYKASSVLLMWNKALTDKVFQRGLQNLLKKNQYCAADEGQLFSSIQTAIEEENYRIPAAISEMMSTWTHQAGYPILTVKRNYEDGMFTVKQDTFYRNGNVQDNKTWYVPINYAIASNPDFSDTEATHYLLNVSETKFGDVKIDKKDWLILNKQSTGFYRINYDAENWNLIAESFIERPFMIHLRNRAQIINDAYHFTIYKNLDHAILLKLLSYLKREDQYAPWSTAYNIIATFICYLRDDNKYDDLKSFIAEQVRPIYKKLGLDGIPGERPNNKYIRSLIINLSCLIGIKECLEETNNKLKDLIRRNMLLEPNIVPTIYCNGMRKSSDEEFYFFYQKLINSAKQKWRFLLSYILSCSQNENHINKYIYSTIDKSNGFTSEERSSLLSWVYQRGQMQLLACIDFLNENWNAYGLLDGANASSNPLDDDIRGMSFYVVNKQQEVKLLALVAKVKNSQYATASLEADVKKHIVDNFQWLKKHGEPIMSWIAQYHIGNGISVIPTTSTTIM